MKEGEYMFTTQDILAVAVRQFWEEKYQPETVVCFFEQRYEFQKESDKCIVIAECDRDIFYNEDDIIFDYDFCEGQTVLENLKIVPLRYICEYYYQNELR